MNNVYAIGDNIISSLGYNTKANWEALKSNKSSLVSLNFLYEPASYVYGSMIDKLYLEDYFNKNIYKNIFFSTIEKMMILSIADSIKELEINLKSPRTIFIISSTKGDIESIERRNQSLGYNPFEITKKVVDFFQNPNAPLVVSNACISGVLSIGLGASLIKHKQYTTAIVLGVDVLTKFVLSGFHSLQALSKSVCKPFDIHRDGINLGEAAATIVLSNHKVKSTDIEIASWASTNDANHISGPSRTGEGLSLAIQRCLNKTKWNSSQVQYISSHGTGTIYNDAMEAKAFYLQKLFNAKINSLKPYFGHTLGAAGILETIIAIQSMKNNYLIQSLGYEENGVDTPLDILQSNLATPVNIALKTSSGFGGGNASILLHKNE